MGTTMIKKDCWVQIHAIVLKPEERTGKLPEDTKKVPLEMWVKGFLQEDAQIGDVVTVETLTGRLVEGTLLEANPVYHYGFGDVFSPELLQVGIQARKIMRGGDGK